MKTINLQQAQALGWCWFANEKRRKQLKRYAAEKPEWTALDILRLPADEVSNSDKLYVVLHPSLIDEPILHSLACDFAESALFLDRNPHPASVKAIEVKRRWIKGEATDEELRAARDEARGPAWATASDEASAVGAVARGAAWDVASDDARAVAFVTANDASHAWATAWSVWAKRDAAWTAASNAVRAWQVSHVIEVLEAEYEAD